MFYSLLRVKRALAARLRVRLEDWEGTAGFRHIQTVFHLLCALAVVVCAIVFFPRPELAAPPEFPREGDIATADIIAPFDFPVTKTPEELEIELHRAERETPPVLAYDRRIADSAQRIVADFFDRAEKAASASIRPALRSERLAQEFPWLALGDLPPPRAGGGWLALRFTIEEVVRRLYTTGIFPDRRFLPASESPFVIVTRPGAGDLPLQRDRILDRAAVRQRLADELAEVPGVDSLERDAITAVIGAIMAPNLSFDNEATDRLRESRLAEVQPHRIKIFRGERIIAKNERVTAAHVERLSALVKAQVEESGPGSAWTILLPVGSRFLFAGLCVAGVALYFALFQRRTLRRTAVIVLLASLWILVLAAVRIVEGFGGPILYLIPVPLAAILVTVLVDLPTGLVSTSLLALLVGIVTGFDFSVFFVALAGGSAASASMRTVRRRYDFYRPALYGGIVSVAAIVVLEALRHTPPSGILSAAGYGLVNAVGCAVLAVGVLPIFESLLGFTTDLTLLELSNFNHPLLKRLSLLAPGTYHHSLMLGNLAEAAAEAIGANSLLARVGAYYHDVGKTEHPEYFVENQRHLKSRHDRLSPSMSALVIETHVKRGKELALEYDLPDTVIDFIEQHHGTTTMAFFYHKAQQQHPDEKIAEDEFRYPGPKPQSRETAIVMLADSTEAVTRTLDDPKPGRLQETIHKVITDKFLDGQLEECNLTLTDLHKIEESFLQLLLGVFHQRIDYPSPLEPIPEEESPETGQKISSARSENGVAVAHPRGVPRPSV